MRAGVVVLAFDAAGEIDTVNQMFQPSGRCSGLPAVDVMIFENPVQVLHWLPEEDRWESIGRNDLVAFVWPPQVCLPGISGGIHYFIVCIHDDDVPLNLIPHKHIIGPDGRIGADTFAGLTRTEREDYRLLMFARERGPSDTALLHEIRRKMRNVNFPPRASIEALRRALPKGTQDHKFCAPLLVELQSGDT